MLAWHSSIYTYIYTYTFTGRSRTIAENECPGISVFSCVGAPRAREREGEVIVVRPRKCNSVDLSWLSPLSLFLSLSVYLWSFNFSYFSFFSTRLCGKRKRRGGLYLSLSLSSPLSLSLYIYIHVRGDIDIRDEWDRIVAARLIFERSRAREVGRWDAVAQPGESSSRRGSKTVYVCAMVQQMRR